MSAEIEYRDQFPWDPERYIPVMRPSMPMVNQVTRAEMDAFREAMRLSMRETYPCPHCHKVVVHVAIVEFSRHAARQCMLAPDPNSTLGGLLMTAIDDVRASETRAQRAEANAVAAAREAIVARISSWWDRWLTTWEAIGMLVAADARLAAVEDVLGKFAYSNPLRVESPWLVSGKKPPMSGCNFCGAFRHGDESRDHEPHCAHLQACRLLWGDDWPAECV